MPAFWSSQFGVNIKSRLIHVTMSSGLYGFMKNASKGEPLGGGACAEARSSETPGQWSRTCFATCIPSPDRPHVQVGNDHIDRHGSQDGDGFVRVCGLEDLEPLVAKNISQHEPQ
jgi:hypothetical protein